MVHSRRANLASSGLLALMVFMGLFNNSVQQYWRNDNKAKTWSNSFGGSAGSGSQNSGSGSYGGSRFESLGPQSIFSASNWNPPAAPPPPPPPPPAAAPAYPSNSNGFSGGSSSYNRGSSDSYVPNYNPSSSGSNSYGYPAPPPPPPPSYPSGSSSGSSSYGSSGSSGSSYGSSGSSGSSYGSSGSSYGSSGSSGSSYGSSGSSYGCSSGNCGGSSGGSYPSYPSNHGNGYAPLPPLPPPPPSYPVNHYNNNFGTGPIQSILPLQPMSLSEIPSSGENLISGVSFDCQARTTGHWRDSRYCDVFHACVYGQLKKTYSCPFVGERSYYDENLKRCEFISKNPSGCHGSSYYH